MIVVGVFLLTTQNALWQLSAAYVTTAFGALGTLAKLFNTYRGSAGGRKGKLVFTQRRQGAKKNSLNCCRKCSSEMVFLRTAAPLREALLPRAE